MLDVLFGISDWLWAFPERIVTICFFSGLVLGGHIAFAAMEADKQALKNEIRKYRKQIIYLETHRY